ncbi:MAG: carbohydrate porin [Leptolyngbyaceae cyanobacterium bins.349]|nr:carbohydrate porin [Leptolyngbyaceae cyanobacterium bins.349]
MTLAIADLGKPGNLLGLVFGQPPKTMRNQFAVRQKPYVDPDTSLHLETFYQWRVVDNFNLSLGLIVVFNPEHNAANDPVYIGTLRSSFLF